MRFSPGTSRIAPALRPCSTAWVSALASNREPPWFSTAAWARRASANRVLTMLKAALNHAYDEGPVANRDAGGGKLKPFRNVEVARVHYLTVAQAERLLNACNNDFRPLVRAA